jgi:uncharacterized protein DUF4340
VRRPVLLLAGLVLALLLAERWLAARETSARAEGRRVGALFTRAEAESLRKQPALRVEASGESHAYGRVEGEWRCLSYHQAPADGRAVQALLDGIVGAEGIVRTSDSAEAQGYGINAPTTLRVSIQGPRAQQDPAGDVLATLEIGAATGERAGCFVRRKGTREVWSIASDLRAPLEARLSPGLPPLLAPAVVPESWLEQGGAVRIVLERGATRTVLEREERALDPAAQDPSRMAPGLRPWRWLLRAPDPGPEAEPREVNESFVGFLERLPYVAVLDPARKAELGVGAAGTRVTLEAPTGPPLVVELGRPGADGAVAAWVAASGTLYRLEASVAALVFPDESLLTASPGGDDPWSTALRATQR